MLNKQHYFERYMNSEDSKAIPLIAMFIFSTAMLTVGFMYLLPINATNNIFLFILKLLLGLIAGFAFSQAVFIFGTEQAKYILHILNGKQPYELDYKSGKLYKRLTNRRHVITVAIAIYETLLTSLISYIAYTESQLKLPKWIEWANETGAVDTGMHFFIAMSIGLFVIITIENRILNELTKNYDKSILEAYSSKKYKFLRKLAKSKSEAKEVLMEDMNSVYKLKEALVPMLNDTEPSHKRVLDTLSKVLDNLDKTYETIK